MSASAVETEPAERPPVWARQAARLHEAFATAAAVASATELGLFAVLEQTPADPAGVAGACGLTERGAHNLFHLFDDANRKLIRRLARSLRPGGRIAIIDVVPNEHLDGPRGAVLYGLGLLQRTATGTIYPYSAYRRWLKEVGFEGVRRRAIGAPLPLILITAWLR